MSLQSEMPTSAQLEPRSQQGSSAKRTWGLGPQTVQQASPFSSQSGLTNERSNSSMGNVFFFFFFKLVFLNFIN